MKASHVPCRTDLPLLEILNTLMDGSGESSCKLGSRLHTQQVLSAADKRGGRWGDFAGEELGSLLVHRAHRPVPSRAQPAGRAVGSAPSLTHACLKEIPSRDAETTTVCFSSDVKVGSVKQLLIIVI